MLSLNEKFTRKVCKVISDTYGVPYDLVRSIIDGLGLYILHEIVKEGKRAREEDDKKKFKISLPNIGNITFTPKKYNSTSAIEVKKYNGNALVSGFEIDEGFLAKARDAYYGAEDPLFDNAELNFNKFIIKKYNKIISEEEDE